MKPVPNNVDEDKIMAISGRTLNQIMDAIRARTPKAGQGIRITETPTAAVISTDE